MSRTAFFLLLSLPLAALSAEIELGQTREQVIKNLGRPKGKAFFAGREILYYSRGTIELTDGKASVVNFVSAEEAARIIQARQDADRARAEARAVRLAAADAERQAIFGDPAFTNKTASEQKAALDAFRRKYPEAAIQQEQSRVEAVVQVAAVAKAAEIAAAEPPPKKPKLSSSKRRRAYRAGNTNLVDIIKDDGE